MYYIPKKQRCKIAGCPDIFSNTYTCFASSSSSHTVFNNSRTVNFIYNNKDTEYKNNGNLNKRGSGGNSYDDYLLRKKGVIGCSCNVNCDSKHN